MAAHAVAVAGDREHGRRCDLDRVRPMKLSDAGPRAVSVRRRHPSRKRQDRRWVLPARHRVGDLAQDIDPPGGRRTSGRSVASRSRRNRATS